MRKPRKRQPRKPQVRGRGRSKFKKSDETRAIKGAVDAGISIGRVTVNPATGEISIYPAGAPEASSDLDQWIAKKDAHQTQRP